jgi:hypothetical protein
MGDVRNYRPWSHEEEICMPPGEVHEPYDPMPAPYDSDLDSALAQIAKQDFGGPRGRLDGQGGRQ